MATNAKNLAELLNTDTTVKVGDIEDGSVTTAKLAADAVTAAKLADDSVVTANVVDGAITAVKTTSVGKGKNLVINGAMKVSQRGTSFTSVSASAYHLDRWQYYVANHDELRTTVSQDSSVPTGADSGFSKSLKIDCTTAESAIAADENLRVWQKVEAQDLIQLGYGSSGAKSTTLSFYVKSSLTGTYAVSFWCQDPDRSISKTYTINAANTWEKKTITIPGDTGGAGITNDNGEGMRINWFLNAGSNFTSTNTNNQWDAFASGRHAFGHTAAWGTNTSHDFFLTGVQFEVGSAATDFEHLSFGEELKLCQRYYQVGRSKISTYRTFSGNWEESLPIIFSTTMRDTPSMAKVTVHTSSRLNGHDTYYPQQYGFCHFAYPSSSGQYISDFTWKADAEL